MKESFLLLFFRRMRVPLIVLISAYSIAVVGFTLMPGVDDEGNPWRLSIFEAFYVVSYTGATIGFGEVPYDFSPAQRLWTILSIYLTVIAWLFSIGNIISLLQDPASVRALRRARFRRAVAGLSQPFYLVCGYGDSGRLITRSLTRSGTPVVVLDNNSDKIDALSVEDARAPVPAAVLDARQPDHLVAAGLRHRWCLGVLAVTGDDRANLKIAIASKLLNHNAVAHARADDRATAANMRSFDTDLVVNPIEEYVRRLRLAIERPATFQLSHWLTSGPDARLVDARQPPRGRWVVCGYGRLGSAMCPMLEEIGITVTVVEEDSGVPGLPEDAVIGRGTEAETLTAAGIETADALLATTRNDVDNLSIVMTARELNPELFVGALETGLSSHELFRATEPDLLAQPSTVIAGSMLSRIRSPLVEPFFKALRAGDETISAGVLERLRAQGGKRPPDLATVRISHRRAPALARALEAGRRVPLSGLLRHPVRRDRHLAVEALMLRRDGEDMLCPAGDVSLAVGDRILVAGRRDHLRLIAPVLESDNALVYALTGEEVRHGWVWRWLARRRGQARAETG